MLGLCRSSRSHCLRPPVTPGLCGGSSRFTGVQDLRPSLPKGRQFSPWVSREVGGSVSWPPPSLYQCPQTQLKSTVHHCQPAGT